MSTAKEVTRRRKSASNQGILNDEKEFNLKPSVELLAKQHKLTHSQLNSFMAYLESIGYSKGSWLCLPMERVEKYFMEWLDQETYPG